MKKCGDDDPWKVVRFAKDPWKVVGFAKDPWRLGATMGAKLIGDEGEGLESDEEKAKYLTKRNCK